MRKRRIILLATVVVLGFLVSSALAWASITGSISGIVTDPTGALVVGATVTAINTQTGIRAVIHTDKSGFYNFPDLSVGTYDLQVEEKGFKTFQQSRIVIDANSAVRIDVKLELGEVTEKVTVESQAVHVETQSTQMGEVINSQKMTAVPLNGRDFTNLLSLQPGVVPFQYANALQDANLSDRTVSGSTSLNAGNQSINGQRETSNGFMVNGANVEEGKNNGTSVIPNLDSIEEFRIITNNFDAEYGNYSGGQVNVVTKSGTNSLHGSAFEFNRNTAFNARNFFSPPGNAPKLIQNQFGGTVGGPIKRDKLFFFADYQGTRRIFAPTVAAAVPDGTFLPSGDYALSPTESGDLAAGAANAAAGISPAGSVQGQQLATNLSSSLGYAVNVGEPYFFTGCTSGTGATPCVFPNAIIPKAAFSPAAVGVLPFIPVIPATAESVSGPNFFSAAFDQRLRDDKGAFRVDANTKYGMLSAYYHVDDDTFVNPYPNSGATVPAPNIGAFTASDLTRAQVLVLSNTRSFGSTSVNEFRFSYVRNGAHLFTPQGGLTQSGKPITLTSLGFTAPAGSGPTFNGGVAPIVPALEGVPSIDFVQELNGTNIGVPADTPHQFNNTFQWQDNFSRIIGTHSLKFGGQFHYDQINDRNLFGENGFYSFDGSESNSDFVDFLIGAPGTFIQATRQILDSRSKYMGLYGQDSWRVTPNLTFNYGLRWEFSQPWYDTQGKIETLIPGRQSVLFPGAPTGWVVPGDPGVPKTLAPTQYHNFSPRLGLAYSPGWDSGFIAKLTGGPGKTSIRAGFGLFYTAFEDLTQFQEIGDAPFGLFWVQSGSFFDAPFMDRGTGTAVQRFPFTFPQVPVKVPNTTFDWAQVEPISGSLAFAHNNKLPYSEHYELSIQRQFGSNTVLSVSYVGTQGHKLLTSIESNPGNAALCLEVNTVYVNAGQPAPCGPLGEGNVYALPPGTPFSAVPQAVAHPAVQLTGQSCEPFSAAMTCNGINGTFTILPPQGGTPQNGSQVFGNNPFEATIAQSSYNSLQASVRHTGNYSTFLFGYTYSKCMDDASELIEGINPFDPRASTSLCAFDVKHNFVASYEAKVPFDRMFHTTSGWKNALASGWAISGITSFVSGLPVSLSFPNDNSLTGTQNTSAPIDLPDFTAGKILQTTNPRKGGTYFNTSLFSDEPLGQIGNAKRRFFYGPGLNNWDMALLKDTKLTESKTIQFRFEAFNIWNHTQFSGQLSPGFGVFGSSGFGVISAAYDPRILQVGLKFLF